MDQFDVVVVGAGVIGLACARALARAGCQVLVIERAARYGSGVSSRSSEVIHAGLHGDPSSLKARLCVSGRALLMDFCQRHGVEHRRSGKLVVATREEDEARLGDLALAARANGVDDVQWLSGRAAQALEPALHCSAALLSPSSGIVDSHGLMTALLADAEAHGAVLVCRTELLLAEPWPAGLNVGVQPGWLVALATGDGVCRLRTGWLVNAAGLDAQAVAGRMRGFPPAAVPQRFLARGHYFSLARCAPFQRLIYPLPVDGGLGIHLTLDLAGQARFGPDVEWLVTDAQADALDYSVPATRRAVFEQEVRRYWPQLPENSLMPGYSGIRPKLSGPGEPAKDFHIAGPEQHGCAGVVQLFGIESPGLTASLAIAQEVRGIVCGAA